MWHSPLCRALLRCLIIQEDTTLQLAAECRMAQGHGWVLEGRWLPSYGIETPQQSLGKLEVTPPDIRSYFPASDLQQGHPSILPTSPAVESSRHRRVFDSSYCRFSRVVNCTTSLHFMRCAMDINITSSCPPTPSF